MKIFSCKKNINFFIAYATIVRKFASIGYRALILYLDNKHNKKHQ